MSTRSICMIEASGSLMLCALNTRHRALALVFSRLPLNALRRLSILPTLKTLLSGWQLQNKDSYSPLNFLM
jgi:hypothetical protein